MKRTLKTLTAFLLLLLFFISNSEFQLPGHINTTDYVISTCNDDDIPCEEIITTQ